MMREEKGGSKKAKTFETFIGFTAQTPILTMSKHIALRQIGFLTNSASLSFAEFEAALKQPSIQKLDTSQNKETQGKYGIFFVSGIPGAGKTDLATSFIKFTVGANWTTLDFAAPVCDTNSLKSQLLEQVKKKPNVRNIIVVLRGYHLVHPYIELLRQDKELSDMMINRGVITKINAMNVYRNKYNELYPCLAENCLKGVSNAIVVERSIASENRVDKILSFLSSLNDPTNIVTMRVSKLTQIAFEDLQNILLKLPTTLYQKYAYTHKKLFQSKYYVPKIMSPVKIKCGIPVQESLFRTALEKVIGEPVKDWRVALEIKDEEEKVANEGKKIYVDVSEEKKIIDYMDAVKTETEYKDMKIERIKGVFTEEGKEYVSNYSVKGNSAFVSVKKLPQPNIDKEQLAFELYGNNIELEQMRELMKLCRTPFPQKKALRTKDTLSKEEVTAILKAHPQKFLPEGILWDGYSYINEEGEKLAGHPNLDALLEWHLNEVNAEIGQFNRKIEKEKKAFEKTYY